MTQDDIHETILQNADLTNNLVENHRFLSKTSQSSDYGNLSVLNDHNIINASKHHKTSSSVHESSVIDDSDENDNHPDFFDMIHYDNCHFDKQKSSLQE